MSFVPEYLSTEVDERIYIHYIGPSVVVRNYVDKKNKFQLMGAISAGYVHYRDEMRIGPVSVFGSNNNSLAEGITWGVTAGLCADYSLLPWLSVGANVDFMYARLTSIGISTKNSSQDYPLDKSDYESLARLDYSLGIHFYF
jgi:hypothetical protein